MGVGKALPPLTGLKAWLPPFPHAHAWGYDLAPLTGLADQRRRRSRLKKAEFMYRKLGVFCTRGLSFLAFGRTAGKTHATLSYFSGLLEQLGVSPRGGMAKALAGKAR